MKKICVITIYIGKLPNYFNLWLESCAANRTIDFLIVTDQELIDLPDNVKKLDFNLQSLKELAEKKLNTEIVLDTPYKCCDYKPMYGLILEDYLRGYDFWGHCDIDLIFGNIRKFVTDDILYHFNKVYHLGHFSLYKNDEFTKHAFKLDGSERGDYKLAISTPKITIFDETLGIFKIYEKNNIPMYLEYDFADVDFTIERMTTYPQINYNTQLFCYLDGSCYRYYLVNREIRKEEFIYIHLQKRKYINTLKNCNSYIIASHQFIPLDPLLMSESLMKKFNPYRGKVLEGLERTFNGYKFRIQRKIKGTTL